MLNSTGSVSVYSDTVWDLVVLGHYKLVLFGTWWYRVSIGLLGLHILGKSLVVYDILTTSLLQKLIFGVFAVYLCLTKVRIKKGKALVELCPSDLLEILIP